MKNLSNHLKTLLNKAFGLSGALYVLFALIIVVVIGGGGYFWNKKSVEMDIAPQTNISPPVLEAEKEISSESANETSDEEENVEEDISSDQSATAWSLLKTALPSRYYKPSAKLQQPSVTIILTGLGLNNDWTHQVLTTLKNKVTLAFSPYSQNLNNKLQLATSQGYEVLIALPMEPYSFPNPDPGPLTLLTGVKPEENLKKVQSILEKAPKTIGVIGDFGSRFVTSPSDLEPVLKEIKSQGRIFVDSNASLYSQVQQTCKILEFPCPQVEINLPISTTPLQEDEFLKKVIQSAKENGMIIVSVPAIPAFIKHLDNWIGTLTENGINIVKMTSKRTQELSPSTNGDNQGVKDAPRQDSY